MGGNVFRAERIRGADPRTPERLCDQLSEALGLPQLSETSESPVTVGCGGVDENTCHVWGVTIRRGIDSLPYARGAVTTLECQLANQDVGERVQ
jgi:hypothetical protein